jgi:hypothetical protein
MKKKMMLISLISVLLMPALLCAGEFTTPIGAVWTDLARPGITKRIASSDTSQTLSTTMTIVSGHYPIAALITCESFDVRVAFGTAAVQTGSSEVGHVLAAGSSMWLYSNASVMGARFINKTNGSNGILQVTYFY